MVECHGSQCGFCTPGFVMSLFALTRSVEQTPGEAAIDDALAGNLCRCTGYGPIIAAGAGVCAEQRRGATRSRPPRRTRCSGCKRCRTRRRSRSATADAGSIAPATVEALADVLLAEPAATIVAGATDVGLWVTKEMRRLDPVIYLGRVRELQRIEDSARRRRDRRGRQPQRCHGGPGAALSGPRRAVAPLRRRAGPQCRHDRRQHRQRLADRRRPPPLIAPAPRWCCGVAQSAATLPLEDFFLDYGKQDRRPGEFVESVRVPKPVPGTRFRAYKISQALRPGHLRRVAAFRLRARAAARSPRRGSPMAAWRRRRSARQRRGGADRPALDRGHRRGCDRRRWREDFQPITDMRASAGYRAAVAAQPAAPASRRDHRRRRETRLGRRPEPRPCLSAASGGVHDPRAHDSARRHVSGEALYIDDLPEPAGLLHV